MFLPSSLRQCRCPGFRRLLFWVWLWTAAVAVGAQGPVLVATNAVWSYRKGTSEASAPMEAWRQPGFDEAGWSTGRAPFYYDTGGGYTGNTELPDMRNGYTSLYLRRTFEVNGLAEIGALQLRFLCDDGFVLWINGVLVTNFNQAAASPAFNTLATGSATEPLAWLGYALPLPQASLQEGPNQLAVQAFNVSRTSSDFVFEMELAASLRDSVPPVVAQVSPPPGTVDGLATVTITFSEPVTGLGFSDLLVNGRPATGVTGSGAVYTFTIDPPEIGPVEVSWDPGAAILDLGSPPNRFDTDAAGARWTYQVVDRSPPVVVQLTPAPGNTVRALPQVEVLFSEPVAGVAATDLEINGLPALAVRGSGAGPYVFQCPDLTPGVVQVEWASLQDIRDLAEPPNRFAGPGWSYVVDPAFVAPTVRLNEILAGYSGDNGLRDEDDELQDWIELHNLSSNPVNLRGWSLTDDPDQPGLWVFPDAPIAPGGFLVVFASGKDRRVPPPAGRLHTNFRLGREGEYLALFNPESPRVRVAGFEPAYPAQRDDYSYGYDADGNLRHFQRPTPGAANGTSSIAGVLPPVGFDVERGVFEGPFELRLTSPVPGVTIRYTTDGADPASGGGRVYAAPIPISTTTVVRAAAFLADRLPSVVSTHTYLFLRDVARQPALPPGVPAQWIDTQGRTWTADYEMDPEIVDAPAYRDRVVPALRSLPSLSLVTRPADMFDNSNGIYPKSQARGPSWERPGSVEFLDPGTGEARQADCGVQMQGNSVRDPVKTGKHAFRIVFKGDYGAKRLRFRVFPDSPVTEFDTLTLRADFNNSWMHWNGAQRPRGQRVRDAWMKDSQRALGGLASHSRFFHLYVNGLYWGVYDATERPDAAFAAAYLGGEKEDFDVVNEGQLVDGNMTAYNAMRALANLENDAQYQRMQQYLDVPAYIDYVLLHFYTGHEDWFTDKNWYASRRRVPGAGFRYQSWDGELMLNAPSQNIVTRNDQPSGLHPKLLANAQYRLDFADRVHRHFFNGGALTPAAAAARYDRWAAQVEPAMVAESARWGDYRRDVHSYSSGPYLLYTADGHFAAERHRLLAEYFPGRTATVLNQLRAAGLYPTDAVAPAFNVHGGRVEPGFQLSMSAPAGTIYYTTDGSDPRLRYSGAVSAAAQVYSGPLTLASPTVVKARTRNGASWSALNEALFETGALGVQLALTEIHYHPAGGDPYEFVEVRNTGPVPVEAAGFSFEGLRYVFPPDATLLPGQTVVLASGLSPTSFAARYPGVPVFGWFEGSLADGGERLALLDRAGRTVVSVDYRDDAGWPAAADGLGPSLELIDPQGDPDAPAAWRASPRTDGSPGQPAAVDALPPVRLNELLAAGAGPDWIELHNAGGTEADLAGWSLSDDSGPGKFTFPAGTRVAAGGFVVVACGGANGPGGGGLVAPFALERSGETVSLFDAAGRRVDAVTFGLQLPELTVGRAGGGGAWRLGTPTPAGPNVEQSLAPPAALRLNELLANPPPGGDDWIELHNSDPARPVALQGLYLATDQVTFRLSSLSFLGPGSFLALLADERPGPAHVDFRLPAAGAELTLHDPAGATLDGVVFPVQIEGESFARRPDGSGPWQAAAPPTPGLSNVRAITQPARLEPLAWLAGRLRVRVHGEPGFQYEFEASADLAQWETVGVVRPATAPFEWDLAAGADTPWQFLRVRLSP